MRDRLRLAPVHEGLLLAILLAAVAVIFSVQRGLDAWGELLRVGWSALLIAGLAGATQGLVEAKRGRRSGLSLTARFFSLLLVLVLANGLSGQPGHTFWTGGVVIATYAVAGFVTWVTLRNPGQRDA